ncbi:Helix-loop-helix DNA-binding domain [Popillia japonica]|uniref:Helix-loop-helix DNA-binding domain n=1 Tax=Popillia japonica TaxID=7064 RepID=A0AAW1KM39_POPJA
MEFILWGYNPEASKIKKNQSKFEKKLRKTNEEDKMNDKKEDDAKETSAILRTYSHTIQEHGRLGPCEVQDPVWAKMSALAPGVKKRKKSETKPQAQINKCNNEKRRREQENIYIEELAELISANFADMSSLSVKPDKCAILQETVNQIRSIKQREGASQSTDPVQQEALEGFLFVVNAEGKVEHVTKNVSNFIKYTEEEVLGKSIYNFIHHGDHARFSSSLLPMPIGWASEPTNKSRSFSCRLLVKPDDSEDPNDEKQPRETRYELMFISSTQLNQGAVADEESGDSGPCLMCVASRITHRDRASIFQVEQFTTKLDTSGKIIGIDTSGVTAYNQFLNKELMDRLLQELCVPQDTHKLTQHLRDTISSGQATSVTYRLRLSHDRYLNVQTKSKLFKANPHSTETDFIMATHSIIGENDSTRPNDPGGGGTNLSNNTIGGPLMTSVVNGTRNGPLVNTNNDSHPISLNNSLNSTNSQIFSAPPFLIDNDIGVDISSTWGDISWLENHQDSRQSVTPGSTPTPRPPSAPTYSPGGPGQSPITTPPDPTFPIEEQKDTKANILDETSNMMADSGRLRNLLTKPPNSVESADSDNKNKHKILKGLLNQPDDDENMNETRNSPRTSNLNHRNSIPGPSDSKSNTSGGSVMLLQLLNEKNDDDDREVRAGIKPNSELLQQLLKDDEQKTEMQSQDDTLLRSLGFTNSPSPTNGESRGRKRPSDERDDNNSKRPGDGVSSSKSDGKLWRKNKMLASLLAKQPNPTPIPPVPNSVITATPQEGLPRIIPEASINKTTANRMMGAPNSNLQQQTTQQHQTQTHNQNVMTSARNVTRMLPGRPPTNYLNHMLTTGESLQRISQQNRQFLQQQHNAQQHAQQQQQQQQAPQQQQQQQQIDSNAFSATSSTTEGLVVTSGGGGLGSLGIWEMQATADLTLSDILDQVIDFVPDAMMNNSDILSSVLDAIDDPQTNSYLQRESISEKMAINIIQRSLMQFETAVNNPSSPNITLANTPPAYSSVAVTNQTNQTGGFPPPPNYQRTSFQKTVANRTGAPQYAVAGPQQKKSIQPQYEKMRLLRQQSKQMFVCSPNTTIEVNQDMQSIDSLLNTSVAPNVSLQRSSSVPESQLSPTFSGQLTSPLGQQAGFTQTTVGNYQHSGSRLSPHPPFNQQLSPRQAFPQGTAQNSNWPTQQAQAPLSVQQQQNPMLNAQLTSNYVTVPGGRNFSVQRTPQQQQRAMGSPGVAPTRHSPFPADNFPPPGSPNSSYNQNQYLRLQRANSAPNATTQLPGVTGGGTASEYVRQELRNVVGARSGQTQPPNNRTQNQLLNQAVTPDLDLSHNFDLPTSGASESPKLWGAIGSDMGSMSPQPATSRTSMEEVRQDIIQIGIFKQIKMLLSLRNDHKEHLQLLTAQSPQVIIDFCKLAIDFLQNGANLKMYNTAAKKLNIQSEDIQNCVYGLVNLLLISCRYKLSEADFRDSVLTTGFSQEQQAVLSKFYDSKKNEISEILKKISIKEPHYHNLNWRFEVQVSSRSLLHQVNPLIAMELILTTADPTKEEGHDKEHIFLQTDPNNLLHLAEELERALIESRSRHSRKVQRALMS